MAYKHQGFRRSYVPPHVTDKMVDLQFEKASDALDKYLKGERKTKPTQKMLDTLEKNGVIAKDGGGYSKVGGKISRIKKAYKWKNFSKETAKDGIDLAAYGYDKYDKAVNPYSHAMANALTGGKINRLKKAQKWKNFSKETVKDGIDLGAYGYDAYNKATNPYGYAMKKAITGGAVKKPSMWLSFVKDFARENDMPYKEALKAASGPYKQMKQGAGYSSAN